MKSVNLKSINSKMQRNIFFVFILRIMSLIYISAIRLRLYSYRKGLLKTNFLHAYTISIGNLTTGGTGKTPFVAMIAKWALKNGFNPAILSRGYKRKRGNKSLIVSDGKSILTSIDKAGDEAFFLAKKLNSLPVLVSKKRYRVGKLAIKLFNSNLLLLDDGYQHLSINRDLNILLIDAQWGFGNGFLLPSGNLREPLEQVKRANLIVITKCTKKNTGEDIFLYLQKKFPNIPVLKSEYVSDKIIFPHTNRAYGPEFLSGKKAVAFAGIARPDDFFDMINSLGAKITYSQGFPDHYSFSNSEINELQRLKTNTNADILLTTEKDWVRIDGKTRNDMDIAVLTLKIELIPGRNSNNSAEEEKIFFDKIEQGINKKERLQGGINKYKLTAQGPSIKVPLPKDTKKQSEARILSGGYA